MIDFSMLFMNVDDLFLLLGTLLISYIDTVMYLLSYAGNQ